MKKLFILFFWGIVSLAQPLTAPAQEAYPGTEQRVALVIGNSDYDMGPLRNPVNDARAMAEVLEELDFTVLKYENLPGKAEMKKAVRDFGYRIQNGGVGLFYYAGHGVQVEGRNYLIPVHATINKEEEVEYESVDVGFVLAQMESARNRMNILILDACRNNPFARSWRSASQGLAHMNAPTGTLIAYATAPGSTASDGARENGLYTQEILQQIHRENLKIEDVFKNVRVNVLEKSDRNQVPWESSSLTGDFYFVRSRQSTQQVITDEQNIREETRITGPGSSATASNIAQWRSADNRYTLLVNDANVSLETLNARSRDDLIVYHPESNRTFLLEQYYELQDNQYRPARELHSSGNAFWRTYGDTYWLYVKGRNISTETKIAWMDEHRLVYHPANGTWYFLEGFTRRTGNTLYPAGEIYTPNGTFWKADEQYYWLYVDGEQIAKKTWATWSGNDLIVNDEEAGRAYRLNDYYNKKDNTLRTADIISGEGIITWKRKENTYWLYRRGTEISGSTVSSWSNDDLLVYEPSTKQIYLLPGYKDSGNGEIREAETLFSKDAAFWRRKENTYWLYVEGEVISQDTEAAWKGNDLEVYHEKNDRTYVLPDYKNSGDDRLRTAHIKM